MKNETVNLALKLFVLSAILLWLAAVFGCQHVTPPDQQETQANADEANKALIAAKGGVAAAGKEVEKTKGTLTSILYDTEGAAVNITSLKVFCYSNIGIMLKPGTVISVEQEA